MILNPSATKPQFKTSGIGGHFKGKNPNISLQLLQDNWFDDASVIYIGKAGSDSGLATLHSRFKQYLNFG
ncbi:MAG: hypothetical protein KKH44_03410 [Bacteroidetes bacterium]|nr:hypothetical protein [Bacteroidota bacterium]